MNYSRDLTKEPPRSPRERVGGYAILARAIDKCRGTLGGQAGEYHFNCPLDQMIFGFKGVIAEEFRQKVESGANDNEIARWVDATGVSKSRKEVAEWSDSLEAMRPYEDPERREWFMEQCRPLGLDPARTTLFDYLEADDRASFGG
jgi:hypothetical protein